MNYLVKQEIDTNDGDYVYGFAILNESQMGEYWTAMTALFEKTEEVEWYILNSPCYITYKDLANSTTVTELAFSDAVKLMNLFGYTYGNFFNPREM